VQLTVFTVQGANVNAGDPHATEVRYHVDPHDFNLDSASFTAPGTTETRSNLPTNFFFSFDQRDLLPGENLIRLESTVGGATKTTDITATRTLTHAPPENLLSEIALFEILVSRAGERGLVTVPVLHSIWGEFAFICYSTPAVPESKTLWVGTATVNISTESAPGIPTQIAAWNEILIYRSVDGDQLEETMSDPTGPTDPPQGPHFRSKNASVDAFFAPNENLAEIGKIDLIVFTDAPGGDPVFPVAPGINTEVDLTLEEHSDVPTTCP
jgi:hypothetical protein